MSTLQSKACYTGWIAVCALTALVIPCSRVHAGRNIQEHRAADPQGEVEIFNVAGTVEVTGWDRSEVDVGGSAGDGIERVDVSGMGNRTSIHVVSRSAHLWGSDNEAHLIVHVPAKSMVTATLVSSEVKVGGVLGDVKLQTVSGGVSGEVGGGVRVNTVSGDVRLTARAAQAVEIKTISGDIHLTGGGGEVTITTVSGAATLELSEVTRARFKSISGDMTVALALMPDGQIEGESVSGDVALNFAAAPVAEFDVQSFSGGIKNCFGPKPMETGYGPGSRLQFMNGDSHARVRINTKSGQVRLCTKAAGGRVSALSLARAGEDRMVYPYVF